MAALVVAGAMTPRGVLAEPAAADPWCHDFYDSLGVAGIKGSANATGSFVEGESERSTTGRLDLGYEATLTPFASLRGDVYLLPQRVPLGLGDEARNAWDIALLPTLAGHPDTELSVGFGYERAQTKMKSAPSSRGKSVRFAHRPLLVRPPLPVLAGTNPSNIRRC